MKLIYIVLMLLPFNSLSQKRFNDEKKIKTTPWIVKNISDYQAVYHFDTSVKKSDLIIIYSDNEWYAQKIFHSWSDTDSTWLISYENFADVRIEGNIFYADSTHGEFISSENHPKKIKGIKIASSNIYTEDQIGYKSDELHNYYPGKYPQSSYRLLSKEEVKKMSRKNINIMRNEIYARYGLIFVPNSIMSTYFKKQNWYIPQYSKVIHFLSELEKENLVLMREVEDEKK